MEMVSFALDEDAVAGLDSEEGLVPDVPGLLLDDAAVADDVDEDDLGVPFFVFFVLFFVFFPPFSNVFFDTRRVLLVVGVLVRLLLSLLST